MKESKLFVLLLLIIASIILISCIPIRDKMPDKFVLMKHYPNEMLQWHYQKIGMMEYTFLHHPFDTSHDIYIAVIDSGIEMIPYQPYHLSQILWGGNTISGTLNIVAPPYTGERHGTNMVSLMIGVPNSYGNVGTCFLPNCKTVIYTSLAESGVGSIESLIAALYNACSLDIVRVINLSVEIYSENEEFTKAVNHCWDSGKVVVIASGNANLFVPYSALLEKPIVVGAIDAFNNIPFLFPVSENITVFAPGVNVMALDDAQSRRYIYTGGTSVATALVSGAVALYLTQNPYATPDDIKDLLYESADRPEGWKHNAGILNINRLIGN